MHCWVRKSVYKINTVTVVKPNEQCFAAPPAVLYLSPSKGTPAIKWRSLAAAAAEKDDLKASTSKPKKRKKVLAVHRKVTIANDIISRNKKGK